VDRSDLRQQVKRAARGDQDAAALIFDAYYGRVYRYAYGRLGNPSDAEDVAAETFARVLRDLGRFRWKGAGFEAWLFRIASNLVVDRTREASKEMVDEAKVAAQEAVLAESPETEVIRRELATNLGSMLDDLVPEQREVLLLRFAADLDTAEVAEVMDKNTNAIRQLQFRALQRMRDKMSEGVAAS
jgi:RNA polymerase sigma-70 factor (ECF subfamily)